MSLILNARRKIAFDLSVGVELDRRADHHTLLNFGGAYRIGERLRVRRFRALVSVGSDQNRLKSVADVEGVEAQLIFVLFSNRVDGSQRRFGIEPGYVETTFR